MRSRRNLAVILTRIAAVLLFFLAWQLVADYKIIDPRFIAGPVQAVASLFQTSVRAQIMQNALPTLYEIGMAFAISGIAGIGIGLTIGAGRELRTVFEPLFLAIFASPKIALLPLFILWFGYGANSFIYFGVFTGIFPVIVNTMAGAKNVNIAHVQLAKSMGAKPWHIYTKIIFPSIIPSAFVGLRLSLLTVAVTVALAEMYLGTPIGLGELIYYWTNIFLTPPLYAVILLFSLVLIGANLGMLAVEKRLNFFRD